MDPLHPHRPATDLAQALGFGEPTTGALVPPIQASTTYERGPDNQLLAGRLYSRPDNPGYELIEAVLNRLEGARPRPCSVPGCPPPPPSSKR